MAENSKIEWTHHTFNPWRGCTKISPGCANCYAEKMSHRNPKVLGEWGPDGTRIVAAESYWRQPLKWDLQAKAASERRRVFCASLADVFEDRPELDAPRQRLFDLILQTPNLDWLLLTKRPEVMKDWLTGSFAGRNQHAWGDGWPNVHLGVSVEDQPRAKERVPVLLEIPAAVHFLSMEPLLGPVDIEDFLHLYHGRPAKRWPCAGRVNWVIVGGESQAGARPMHPDWARSLRDQCQSAGVPFFFKQWGEWVPLFEGGPIASSGEASGKSYCFRDGTPDQHVMTHRVGKKAAGRLLDGREWSEFPEAAHAPQV